VLRPVARVSGAALECEPDEGRDTPAADSRRGSLPAQSQCEQALRAVRDDSSSSLSMARGSRQGLVPPAPAAPPPRVAHYEPYLFAVSRFTRLKRMSLIVDALAQPEASGINLVLAGGGEELPDIQARIRGGGLEDGEKLT